jgi:Pyridoxamine 5'-phosphate oxidase like
VVRDRGGHGKLRSLEADPHINLSYYKDRTREWISVSGLATISRDRQKIRELYASDWKMWFPDEGDVRHGAHRTTPAWCSSGSTFMGRCSWKSTSRTRWSCMNS